MELFFLWFVFAFVVAAIGSNRTIGFWGALILSLLLSPLIGIIVVALSRSKTQVAIDKKNAEHNAASARALAEMAAQTKAKPDIATRLAQLRALLDNGTLTQEEYDTAKAKALVE